MAAISNHDLRKKLDLRFASLAADRKCRERPNEEVARFSQRWLSPYVSGRRESTNRGNTTSGGYANNRLYNAKALIAHRTLTAGMSSGLSSPSQPWFKFAPSDPDMRVNHAVKEWCDEVTNVVSRFLYSTNIYPAMTQGYGELGNFGSEATLFVPHLEYGAVAFPLTWGEYWIGADDGLRISQLYRDCTMTVAQAVAKFGLEKLSKEVQDNYKAERLMAPVAIRNAIEPNTDRVYGKIDRTNKPFRSVYWEVNAPCGYGEGGILAFEGFDRKPFATPRWATMGMDAYATGPGFDALPESMKLQLQEIRLQGAMDYTVKPPLQAPITARNDMMNLIPGSISFTSAQDMNNGARPVWEVPAAAIPNIAGDIQRTEKSIDDAYFTPLFNIFEGITGTQPRTAEEIARRHEERLALLGPVVDRVQNEKLSVIVLQAFSICSDLGMLPPVPDDLDGQPISIEFVSVLAQAQRLIGLGSLERAAGFIGNLAGVKPEVLDVMDADDMAREYWDRVGAPQKAIRSLEDVAAIRDQRAQQAAAAQAAAAAPALRDVAQGAELLSRTDVNGSSLLNRLLPQPGA